jgi:large subunit ribosomal protein L18
MASVLQKVKRRAKLRKAIRAKIFGTAQKPRLSVFRSNVFIYAQLIDDLNGLTLASASSAKMDKKGNKVDQSNEVGKMLAEKAIAAGITSAVFDRGGYLFHGRVKSLAEGAREGGLKF